MARIEEKDGITYVRFSPMRGVPFYRDWLTALLNRGLAREVRTKDIDPETNLPRKKIVPLDRNQEQPAILDEHGNVLITCIGCGIPFNSLHDVTYSKSGSGKLTPRFTDQIRIGGFVQMPHEDHLDKSHIEVKWRFQPMFKVGLGCDACKERYQRIVADTNLINKANAVYISMLNAAASTESKAIAKAYAEANKNAMVPTPENKCIHGMMKIYCAVCQRGRNPFPPSVKVETARELTPFIDVFEAVDAMERVVDATID